jgi:phosphoenolpyruvate synthase/pyruvate phosphate dikinase
MQFTQSLKNLTSKNVLVAWWKWASLGEMLQNGIPVPWGFVVLSTTFDYFIEKTWLDVQIQGILDTVNHKTISSVEEASESIQSMIMSFPMPEEVEQEIYTSYDDEKLEYVAVRSSATAEDGAEHAWAGQLDSFLNTTRDTLIEKVRRCWASLFTPRAIFYRFEKDLDKDHISVAVVVQKMVQSEVSGIAFSVHPVTQDRNQMIIEAWYGLGEAIVSGAVTPDSYVVRKDNNEIDIAVNHQQKALYRAETWGNERVQLGDKWKNQILSQEQIWELAKIILRIENHYGFPCDIEWAYEGEKFYIVQSRPITTITQDTRERFEKTYTRDTTLIIQQAWNDVFINWFVAEGIHSPYEAPVIHYMHWGTIEIWENETCTHYYLDELLKKHSESDVFYRKMIDKYLQILAICEQRRKEKYTDDMKLLKDHVQMIFDEMKWFVTFYFAGYDERVPESIREDALKTRETDSFFASNDKYIRESLMHIYPHLKWYESCILWQEIDNPPTIDELKKRRESYLVQWTKYSAHMSVEEYASQHPNYYFHMERVSTNNDVLQWQTGYAGRVRWKVFVLLRNDQVQDVKEWDIIVSPMTTPEHVPAMQKAAAFITDEWWITCHAAIVARELKKPCVIGTKFATQLLKDGDEIEVDADNGVVKIIKKPISKADWHHLGKRIEPALAAELWMEYGNYAQMFFTNKLDGKILYLNGDFFLSQHDVDYIKKESYEAAKQKDMSFFVKIKDTIISVADKIIAISKESTDVVSFLEAYKELTWVWMPLNIVALGVEEYVNEVDASVFKLATWDTIEKPWSIQQEDDMRKIKYIIWHIPWSIAELSTQDHTLIKQHIAQYAWKGSHHFHIHAFTEDELLEQMKNDKGIEKTLYSYTEEQRYLVEILDLMGFVRFRAWEASGISTYNISPLLTNLAAQHSCGYDDIMEHMVSEIRSWNISKKHADARRENTWIYFDWLVESILSNRQTAEYESSLLSSQEYENIIKWLVANKWFATGKVKIMTHMKHAEWFVDGMILVAYETTPDLISFMKRAWAIVTDFGWLTSHAAIVAREFNIPCIVWTQNATKMLKDWDLVEVDANSGIVKVLQSSTAHIDTSGHIRLFAFHGYVPFVVSDEFMNMYKNLGGIAFSHKNIWLSYMSQEAYEETTKKWLALYSSEVEYKRFVSDLYDIMKKIEQMHEDIVKDKLTHKVYNTYIQLLSDYRSLYAYTEFFYTDKAFLAQSDNPIIQKNFTTFEQVKLNWRSFLNTLFFIPDSYFNQLLQHIAIQCQIAYEEIASYSLEEIRELLDRWVKVSWSLLQARQLAYIIESRSSALKYNEGKAAYEDIESFLHQSRTTVLTWQVASKGKVTGKAKVIKVNLSEYNKLQGIVDSMGQWDILVAETTEPSIIAACAKAWAIITNQGWMMSHAAIVSRELSIPCIVWVGNATEVIEDWDSLEVDADIWVIKIII